MKKGIILIFITVLFYILSSGNCNAQKASKKSSSCNCDKGPKIYEVCDEDAQFKDGDIDTFIKNNLQYPIKELDKCGQWTVILAVVIDLNGKLTQLEILSQGPMEYTEEAKCVVCLTNGKWIPGKANGNFVNSSKMISVRFVR